MKYGIEFHYHNNKKEKVFYKSQVTRDDLYAGWQQIINDANSTTYHVKSVKKIER